MSINQARALIDQKNYSGALLTYDSLKSSHAKDVDYWLEYGLVAADAGHYGTAEQCVVKALRLRPNNPAAYYVWGKAKNAEGDRETAEELFAQAFTMQHNFDFGAALLSSYTANKKYKKAQQFLEKLKKLVSNDDEKSKVIFAEGNILLAQSKTKEAIAIFENALKNKTSNFKILREYISATNPAERNPEIIKYYQDYASRATESEPQIEDLFLALGKVYEEVKDYKTAAEYFNKGKKALSSYKRFDNDLFKLFVERSKAVFNAKLIKEKQPEISTNIKPIFIVGMPRSGTTLLEQVLATNPKAYACGELYTVGRISSLAKIKLEGKGYIPYPTSCQLLPKEYFGTAAKTYLTYLKTLDKKSEVFIDKMPSNVSFLGLINIMLPQAKIIHLKRDLRDVALSLYTNNFADSGLKYSNRFEDIVLYIEKYLELNELWKKTIPESFIDIKYSDLVNNFDETTKKVFDYCGLEWTEDTHNFHKKEGSVNTASRLQVRQPLYKSSVEKWRNYEPYFGKYFDEITKLAEKYEYSW